MGFEFDEIRPFEWIFTIVNEKNLQREQEFQYNIINRYNFSCVKITRTNV